MRRLPWLLPFAAFLAVLPLLTGGDSCGKDFTFHMQSWLGAAGQLRHGVIFPRWNFLAAYNAGDPRFIFYPPLSWELGAALTLVLPFSLVPTALTWIILTVAGWAMFRFARTFTPEPIAFLSACIYLANPFMLWTITGRNAYAELLAAACCPLLLAAMTSERTSPWRIGLPLALMWLSNVPGGAIGTYLVVFLAVLRLTIAYRKLTPLPWRERSKVLLLPLSLYAGGLLYGFTLAGFFLVPALWERRYIHMSEAFGTHLRPTDNLFFHRALLPTDGFFVRTEHIAVALALVTAAAFAVCWYRVSRKRSLHSDSTLPSLRPAGSVGLPLATLSLAILFMTTFLSAPVWRHLPALWVVQFPWRLLFVLGACSAAAVALALREVPWPRFAVVVLSFAFVPALAFPMLHQTRVVCTNDLTPRGVEADLLRHHTPEPTDEYVVATGNPDFMRPDNPPFWVADQPTAYAPGTTPNPAAIDPTQQWPLVPERAHLDATPLHFSITSSAPAFLVVNLQDYPNWRITRDGAQPLPHLPRPDGLLTVAIPPGPSSFSITWRHSWDEYLGAIITLLALITFFVSRKRPVFSPASATST